MSTTFVDPTVWQEIAATILQLARKEGATSAEVSAQVSDGFSLSVRLGEVETIEYHRDKSVDITVYFGHQQGASSTTDVSHAALEKTVRAACTIAKATGEDPYNGLAEPEFLARTYPDCDLYHPWSIDVNKGIDIAKACETYGRQYDKQITNSDGASLSTFQSFYVYANSNDFIGFYPSTRHSFHCILLAEIADDKQRDYEYTTARSANDLADVQFIGESAAQKVISRLKAQKLTTRQTPVIFAAPVASGLMGHFVAAIRGNNLYRRSSFLVDHLHKKVFPSFIHIMEQPHLLKGIGSAPFDNEGVATQARKIIDNGILQNYVLGSYSARKLGMQTTGNAGGVHNLTVQATAGDLASLLKQMDTGLLVTEVMGQGVNIVTGDYSRGATGFWIERGEIQYPVHEITIAGNLRDMLMHIQAAGSDIDHRGNICSGSLLIENMTIAGE